MKKSKEQITFKGKLALQQRVLPSYRVPFFQALASKCEDGLSLFAGAARPIEAIKYAAEIEGVKLSKAENKHILGKQFYLLNQTNVINWLEETDPDILIVEANPRYLSTPSAVKWMHEKNRKVLGWGLGAPPISGLLNEFREKRRLDFLSHLDGIISYSERGVKEYQDIGIPAEKVFVAHNAAVHRPLTPPPLRSGKKSGPMNILFVGRIQKRKKLDRLFHACAELAQKPNIVVVGDGPDKPYFEFLAAKIYPGAVFVGAKYGDELRQYYANADLFVLPGTGGLAVQQAMANGLPVIVAQGDGTQDDLVRPGNGWLIPPDDQSALKSTLKDALSDLPRLRKMGAESFRITFEEINIDTMAEKFINALNKVIKVSE